MSSNTCGSDSEGLQLTDYNLKIIKSLTTLLVRPPNLKIITTLTSEFVGMIVRLCNLSEPQLNDKNFRIVKVYPKEEKICVDVTPPDWPPTRVRYLKVSVKNMGPRLYYSDTQETLDIRSVMAASNRDAVFATAGYHANDCECLAVRAHPAIERGRLWRDLPLLCNQLNKERSHGHPFTMEFGFQIFAKAEESLVKEMQRTGIQLPDLEFESAYSAEPYLVLRDCRGCAIDAAPDIAGSTRHKLFIPDPAFSQQTWMNMLEAVSTYVEIGWMPTTPFYEKLRDDQGDDAVSLGMIRGDLNSVLPSHEVVIMCHAFTDSKLTLPHKERSECYASLVELRRASVTGGAVFLSRNLAKELAAKHANDHVMYSRLACRQNLGTICFGCYTRLTEEEAKICNGCGKARYCSRGCQRWHWKDHKWCCASPEQRAQRRSERAVRDATDKERLRLHDEHEALLKAEATAKEAARKARAARARVERADQCAKELNERIKRAAPKAQPVSKFKGRKSAVRTKEQEIYHVAWDSEDERVARTAAFMIRQEAESLEATARKAQKEVDAMKKLARDTSAAREAATHCLPCAPTVNDALSVALNATCV